jgi:hypothetical protein
MRVLEVPDGLHPSSLEGTVRAAMAVAPPDVVLQLRVPLALAGSEALRAARLRALAPRTANVTVSVRGLRPRVASARTHDLAFIRSSSEGRARSRKQHAMR